MLSGASEKGFVISRFVGVADGKGSTLFLSTLNVKVESMASFVSEHDAKVNMQTTTTINPRTMDMGYLALEAL
jgi:hypothetical protein